MSVEAYIYFNGDCREAVEFYAKVFRTELPQFMSFGDAPPDPEIPVPEEAKKLIMHTQLNICGSNVMFSDAFPGTPFIAGNNISLTVLSKDVDEIKSFFDALKVDGTVGMELQETFWAKCYGLVTDKYGILWQLSCESEQMVM